MFRLSDDVSLPITNFSRYWLGTSNARMLWTLEIIILLGFNVCATAFSYSIVNKQYVIQTICERYVTWSWISKDYFNRRRSKSGSDTLQFRMAPMPTYSYMEMHSKIIMVITSTVSNRYDEMIVANTSTVTSSYCCIMSLITNLTCKF